MGKSLNVSTYSITSQSSLRKVHGQKVDIQAQHRDPKHSSKTLTKIWIQKPTQMS